MLKYLLLGRIGSGRAYFQKLLSENGLHVAKSYTTREQKDEADTFHYFINREDVKTFSEKLFITEHDGNVYFYTKNELETSDIIPVDPENVEAICCFFPDTAFRFIEIMASNEDRIKHATSNANDKLLAEEEFITACENENDAFCAFEDAAVNKSLKINNLIMGHMVNNDFTDKSDIYDWISKIKNDRRIFEKMSEIIKQLGSKDILPYDEKTSKYALFTMYDNTPHKLELSLDCMVEQILIDPKGMCSIMTAWLSLESTHINNEKS